MTLLAETATSLAQADQIQHLLDRAGTLKGELVEFGLGRRWERELDAARDDRFGPGEIIEEHEWIAFVDHFLLQHRLADGRTVLQRFVAARGDLPRAEREMLLGWGDVVEGMFEIEGRVGDVVVATNVIDELSYTIGATMGGSVWDPVPVPGILITRVIRVGPIWAVSGSTAVFELTERQRLYPIAAEQALLHPELCFRNPEKLARACEIERLHREAFLDHFGADLVVFSGAEFHDRLHEYWRVCNAQALVAGMARVEESADPPRLLDEYGLAEAETVAAIFDLREGLSFHPEFGRLQAAFADPELLDDERYREIVFGYLHDPDVSALPLRRVAERDHDRASAVFARVLGRSGFRWERDGERLLRQAKPDHVDGAHLPRMALLGPRLTDYLAL